MRSKGVNNKLYPSALRFMKPNLLKFVDATVIGFRFFNQIKKKKEKNMKIVTGVNFYDNLHFDEMKLKVKIGISSSMVE